MDSADIVVIGGGCMGTSIAYNLKKRGVDRVVLLEKNYVGSGATGRSVGVVREHYSTEFMVRMAKRSLSIIRNFEKEVGFDSGYRKTGLIVAVAQDGIEALKDTVSMQRSLGVDTRVLPTSDLKAVQPELFTEDLAGGAYEPGAGYADPSLVTVGYAKAAEALGVKVLQKTEVVNVKVSGNKIAAVETRSGERIEIAKLVNATNAWANRINRMVGIELPIQSVRSQVIELGRPPDFQGPHAVIFDFVNSIYLRSEGNTRTIVGTLDPQVDLKEPIDPDQYSDSVDYEHVEMLSGKVLRRLPPMERAVPRGGWSGPYDVTPDWHPILDESEQVQGYFVAAGFSGHGFKLCPGVGEMMASLVMDGEKASSDIKNFKSTRFKEGKLIVPRYSYSLVG
jgi:sarcosine oxidase subunit beta